MRGYLICIRLFWLTEYKIKYLLHSYQVCVVW